MDFRRPGGCPDCSSRGVGRQGMGKAKRAGWGRGRCDCPGAVRVRSMSGDWASERGEECSGEKGEEALQKREQYTGHADCHEPPEPAKFITHHVHVGPDFLNVR